MVERQRAVQHNQDLWDKIWRDKRGNVVIYQNPNLPLIGWLVLTILSLFTNGTVSNIIGYIGMASLAVWAVLEAWKGVDYFRRALGVVVAIMLVVSLIHLGF